MTVPRYIAIAATAYLVILLMIVVVFGGWHVSSPAALRDLWPLIAGAIAMAILGTIVPIARFGHLGGSIYAAPTLVHVCVLLVMTYVMFVAFL